MVQIKKEKYNKSYQIKHKTYINIVNGRNLKHFKRK